MNREVLRCYDGHELRAIGEGISYCHARDRCWLWEVKPKGAEWRFPGAFYLLNLGDYKARIFDVRRYGAEPTEADAKAFAMEWIHRLTVEATQ